jgi:hypothetical protein
MLRPEATTFCTASTACFARNDRIPKPLDGPARNGVVLKDSGEMDFGRGIVLNAHGARMARSRFMTEVVQLRVVPQWTGRFWPSGSVGIRGHLNKRSNQAKQGLLFRPSGSVCQKSP